MRDLIFRLDVDTAGKTDLSEALDELVEGHSCTTVYHPGDDFLRVTGNIMSKDWTMYDMAAGSFAIRYSVEPAPIKNQNYKEMFKGSKTYRRDEPENHLNRVTVQIRLHGMPEDSTGYQRFTELVKKIRDDYPEATMRFGAEVSKVASD